MSAPKIIPADNSPRSQSGAQSPATKPRRRRRQTRLTVAHVYAEQVDPQTMDAIVQELLRLLNDRPTTS